MKKIYSLLTLFVASLLGMAAQAETRTVTFHVDDPSHIASVKIYSTDVTLSFDDNNTLQMTFGEEYGQRTLVFEAADNCKITSIKKADGSVYSSSWVLYPDPNRSPETKVEFCAYNDEFLVEDGDVVNIETQEAQSKIFTIKANPDHIKYVYAGSNKIYMDETGIVSYNVTDLYYLYVYLNDDHILRTVTDDEGNEQKYTYSSYSNYISFKVSDYPASATFNIDSYSKEDLRTASLTVNVDGDPSRVYFKRNGEQIKLTEESTTIKFNPETETGFELYHTSYSSSKLFSVTVNGTALVPEGRYNIYSFNANDGDELNIQVESNVEVPVKFVFTNPDTEGALSQVYSNGVYYTAEEALFEGFSLKLGSSIIVEGNEDEFEIDEILYNGVADYSGTIDTEDEYVVTITATKIPTKDITIKCDAWEHVYFQDSNSYYNNIELTGTETILSYKEFPYYLKAYAKDGYILQSVTDEAGNNLLDDYYGRIYDFTEGMTIVVDAKEFVRDQEMVIFLEDVEWKRQDITLNDYTDFEKKVTLDPGYNHVLFGENDFSNGYFPLSPVEGELVMYLNDEKVEMEFKWGDYYPVGFEAIKAGDVLKIYAEEKDTHTISYDIAEGVNAAVFHDHVTAIESPATHAVLPGTEIHIKPVATMAARAAASPLVVKVNDQTIEPAADGVYTITADGDKNIKVENDPSTSIAEISADAADKAFDIMGRRVNANHRGITIVNGKKVMK